MNDMNIANSPKKVWTQPAIKVISLNSARVTTHVSGSNDGAPNKS
jgi:hypothetical protein